MARVYKRSDKRDGAWWIEFRDERGRKRRRKIGPNKRQAEEALDRVKVQVAQQKFLPEQVMGRIGFDELTRKYLELAVPALRSAGRVRGIVARWERFFGKRRLRDITAGDVAQHCASRMSEVRPATINREVAILKRMFNLALQWGLTDRNPLHRYRMLPERNQRYRWLTAEEASRLVIEIPEHLRPILLVAMNTGARRSELTGLVWPHVHFDTKTIAFVDTKSGHRRDVPMNRIVLETLMKLPRKGGLVFQREGRPLGDFRGAFRSACQRAGIEDGLRWHDLRHSYATAAVRSGMDIRTLQYILGHRTITMTMRYSHVASDHAARAANEVELGPDPAVRERGTLYSLG